MAKRLLLPGLLLGSWLLWSAAWPEATPSVMPKIEEVQVTPPVELPGPATPSPAAPEAPLTIAEAVALALHNQPSLNAVAAAVRAAEGRTQATRAGLQPQAVLAAGVNVSAEDGTAGAPSNFLASATLKRLLFDYHHTRDLVNQAQAQETYARAALTAAQADLVLKVKRGFYALAQAQNLITVAETNLRNRWGHLTMSAARLQSGFGLPYDVVRAETAYAEAVDGLTVARNTALQARVTLAQLLGLDPRTPLALADEGETPVAGEPLDKLVDEATQRRPELAQGQAALLAARHSVAAARTVNSPVVTGNVGVAARGDEFLPGNTMVTAGVGVQWNASDGGLTKGRVQETQANVDAAAAQLEVVKLQVVADVSQAYLDLKTAQQRVITTQAGVLNATEALRLAEGRYRAGLGEFIDILDAQAALDAANNRQVNARTGVLQAQAALERATGRNLPSPQP